MAVRKTTNVSLTPELDSFVAGRIASGRYRTASEVVRAALRCLEKEERAAALQHDLCPAEPTGCDHAR